MLRRFFLLSFIVFFFINNLYTQTENRGVRVKKKSSKNRIALIIGNGAYKSSPLRNPVNDAQDMAELLKTKGFEVSTKINAGQKSMKRAILEFGKKIRKGGVGLFYYAGHGMQVKGVNYLIPVGVNINEEDEIEFEAIDANRVLSKMESAGNDMNIIILDACRDNPFKRSFRSGARGLARMDAPKGSLIVYATSPGKTAADGKGRNGVFTKHLLKTIKNTNLEIGKLLRKVRENVISETSSQQIPWESSSIVGDFYFSIGNTGKLSSHQSNLPSSGDLDLSQFKKKNETIEMEKKRWSNWQRKFENNFNEAKKLDTGSMSSVDKQKLWGLILKQYSDDNPYSGKDEEYRKYAEGRIAFWKKSGATFSSNLSSYPSEIQSVARKAKKVRKNSQGYWEVEFDYGIVMVYVPAGEFAMGSNNGGKHEKPEHKVYLDGYWLSKYETTLGQFKTFVSATGHRTDAEKSSGASIYSQKKWVKKTDANYRNPYFGQNDSHPVVCVSWNDARAFCGWLSRETGLKFRLPTEAEWEKGARGRDGRKYSWGNSEPTGRECNYADMNTSFSWSDKSVDDGYKYTAPVGSYSSGVSPYGLQDMSGNVWEWCLDWYDETYYQYGERNNPKGASSGRFRVLRGGGWVSLADYVRSAFRGRSAPSVAVYGLGFRPALGPQ